MLMSLVGIIFFVLLVLGMPLAFTIGIAGLAFLLAEPDLPLTVGVQKMISSTQSFPLLAVPFFVCAGHLMNASGITTRLIRFSTVLTGHLVGGLAHVSIVLSALMGGISGSAVADVAMESRLLGPSMIQKGYSKGYTAAVIGLSGLITATIPPSIGLILYGFVGEVSIGKLLVAGVMPGLYMTAILMAAAYITARKKGYGAARPAPTAREVWDSFIDCIWALIFPVILIVGIRFGIFTPSEAGAFAVVYAFAVGWFIYRELTWEKIRAVLKHSVNDNGIIMLIIACSGIFGYATVYDGLPQTLAEMITSISSNPTVLLFVVLAFLFIAGMFMEATVNTLLLTPIFLPIMKSVGIDPVHFGLLMMTIVTMGGMTPPVGVAMFTACSLLDCPTDEYIVESVPFIAAIVIQVLIMALFPETVLWLPNLVFGK
jgi:tripartite ATP-independent transporter DctM subunit